ncbi:MAG: hypothetical protein JXQ29_16380 [Planctomycetes bacterium]|nr:hypothetical protein [Planctomycetota bacterium]
MTTTDTLPDIGIDVNASLLAAREHLLRYPHPGGRRFEDLIHGKAKAPEGPPRCLWPACYDALREALVRLEPPQRDRWLWSLYYLQVGEIHPERWMFWRAPPRTQACLQIEAMVYAPPLRFEEMIRYGDGTGFESEEGRRRAKANIAEIKRRLGWKRAAGAFWRGKLEAEAGALRRALRDEHTTDEGRARARERLAVVMGELNAAGADARAWDWERGQPAEEEVPF